MGYTGCPKSVGHRARMQAGRKLGAESRELGPAADGECLGWGQELRRGGRGGPLSNPCCLLTWDSLATCRAWCDLKPFLLQKLLTVS